MGFLVSCACADPQSSPVWEITGAQFSKSPAHTACSISIRFPRFTKVCSRCGLTRLRRACFSLVYSCCLRLAGHLLDPELDLCVCAQARPDKSWKEATDLPYLKELVAESKLSEPALLKEIGMKRKPKSKAKQESKSGGSGKGSKGSSKTSPASSSKGDSKSSGSSSPAWPIYSFFSQQSKPGAGAGSGSGSGSGAGSKSADAMNVSDDEGDAPAMKLGRNAKPASASSAAAAPAPAAVKVGRLVSGFCLRLGLYQCAVLMDCSGPPRCRSARLASTARNATGERSFASASGMAQLEGALSSQQQPAASH